jgi:HSP20 family molecular chaperone IbpA
MASPQCTIDHQAIATTVKNTMEKVLQSSVQITNARPMWVEGFRDIYDEIPLQPSDQFYDKESFYELKQHYPMVDAADIILYEKNNHLHLSVKKNKGNIQYSVQKQIPIPPTTKVKGITSHFINGTLTIVVPK